MKYNVYFKDPNPNDIWNNIHREATVFVLIAQMLVEWQTMKAIRQVKSFNCKIVDLRYK